MKYTKLGTYHIENNKIYVFMDIRSWDTMKKVRKALSKWLPDLPTWRSEDYYVPTSYFRNSFKWDGEYSFYFPLEAEANCASILRKA